MNREINKSLSAVRQALSEAVSVDTTLGTQLVTVASGTPTAMAAIAPAVHAALGSPEKHGNEPYDPELKDVKDTFDHLDMYLKTLTDLVLNWYGWNPDKAAGVVFDAIGALVKAGLLTDLPGDDATPETLQIWIESAKKAGLGVKVQELAYKKSKGSNG
jgi:hypothetical protein